MPLILFSADMTVKSFLLGGACALAAVTTNVTDVCAQTQKADTNKVWRCKGQPDRGPSFILSPTDTCDVVREGNIVRQVTWHKGATQYDVTQMPMIFHEPGCKDTNRVREHTTMWMLDMKTCRTNSGKIDSLHTYTQFIIHPGNRVTRKKSYKKASSDGTTKSGKSVGDFCSPPDMQEMLLLENARDSFILGAMTCTQKGKNPLTIVKPQ